MNERLLGTEDIAERTPFSLSKIQEMAKSGDIPMIIFPGSRKYVILESAFNSWLRRVYSNGVSRVDKRKTVCSGDDKPEALQTKDTRHFTLSGGKVAIKVQPETERRKARNAGDKNTISFDRRNIR